MGANVQSDIQTIARDALVALVQSEGTPAAVKAAAARTLLELCGAIGSRAQSMPNSADAEGMTLQDIDAEIRRLSRSRDIV